ncbi:MAG: choice-of-anchor D domain-containing protein, partial [Bdellovibrionales bacterium]|nr:choice-of-anchor D domain-containing protein [Bdellovibrionales bacterium]
MRRSNLSLLLSSITSTARNSVRPLLGFLAFPMLLGVALVAFTASAEAQGSVTGLTLVNAATEQDIGPLSNGAAFAASGLPLSQLNVRAETTGSVGSVVFAFNGNATFRTESAAPYTLGGDFNGDYFDLAINVGSHTVTATPYSGSSGSGTAGVPFTVTFSITSGGLVLSPLSHNFGSVALGSTQNVQFTLSNSNQSSTGAFQETGGIVVWEVESKPAATGWTSKTTIPGYTGTSYYEWTGADSFGSGGNGTITYEFQVQTPGNYELRWRSRIAVGDSSTEHNDSWVQFPSGQNITGEQALNGNWTKVYTNQKNVWSWNSLTVDNVGRPIRQFFSAGTHQLKISGRSQGHAIDRIALFKYDAVSFNASTFTALPQSNQTGGSGPSITVQSIGFAGTHSSDFSHNGPTGSFALAPGQQLPFTVTFDPNDVGTRTAQLVVNSNAPTSPEVALLEGIGEAGSVSFSASPTDHDFGSVVVGQQSPQPLTVQLTNNGSAPVTVTSLTISGDNIGDFSFSKPTPFTVGANSSDTVSVSFSPTAVGPRTASLAIQSNASGSPHDVSLTGTGENAPQGQSVTALVLINTDTDQDIGALTNGGVLNLASLGNPSLNVRAETNPATVGSVKMELTGPVSRTQTESVAPYALFQDIAGDYQPGTLTPGAYTLTATPYPQSGAKGTAGTALTLSFTVQNQTPTTALLVSPGSLAFGTVTVSQQSQLSVQLENTGSTDVSISDIGLGGTNSNQFGFSKATPFTLTPGQTTTIPVTYAPTAAAAHTATLSITSNAPSSPDTVTLSGTGQSAPQGQSVTSLVLVNADTDQDIAALTNGGVINLAALGNPSLNVRAETSPTTVGSVKMELTGPVNRTQTESVAPYALFQDISGDYQPGTLTPGAYTLTATPYTQSGAKGTAGTALTVSFTVQDQTPTTSLLVSPGSLAFGTVTVAQQSQLSVQLENNGSTNVSVTNVGLNGANADQFSFVKATPFTLTPGQTTTIPVTYAPTSASAHTATLDITSNAPSSPDAVTLSGTGISGQSGISIISFTLIDAETDQDIRNINNQEIISLEDLPTTALNIRANTSPATVGSVVFDFDGTTATESVAPYALFGDQNGNYTGGSLTLGAHTLTATPYVGSGGSGEAGMPLTVSFTVVDSAPQPIVRVNAGGPQFVDGANTTWAASSGFFSQGALAAFNTTAAIANTNDDPLYQSELSGTFGYQTAVDPGTYRVSLLFAEIFWTTNGQRVFDVQIENALVLDDYDIIADVGPLTAVTKTFDVEVTDGTLNMGFVPSVDRAKISAIAIDRIGGDGEPLPIQFTQRIIASPSTSGAAAFANPTSLQLGPDGRLYVAQQNGLIHIFTLNVNKEVVATEVVNAIFNQPTLNEDGAPSNCPTPVGRQVTGLYVDAQANIYVAHSDPRIGVNSSTAALCIDTDGGVLTKLLAPNYNAPGSKVDLVTGLGRSRENHAPNGLQAGPDGWLYLSVGGNTNYGAPSTYFSNVPETNAVA